MQLRVIRCGYCAREMKISHREYLANPFCASCIPERLESSGAIDLRDNSRIIDLGNGYMKIEPIDPTKLFKADRS